MDDNLMTDVSLVRDESKIHADSGDMAVAMQGRKFLALCDAIIAIVAALAGQSAFNAVDFAAHLNAINSTVDGLVARVTAGEARLTALENGPDNAAALDAITTAATALAARVTVLDTPPVVDPAVAAIDAKLAAGEATGGTAAGGTAGVMAGGTAGAAA